MDSIETLLREARTIELVDWPNQRVPATLHRAGYYVVGHEPDGYKHYHVESTSDEPDSFPLPDGAVLVSSALAALPVDVHIVCTYRPPEEQPEIAREAAKLGVRGFWVEPGEGTSQEARSFTIAQGITFVDGEGIADAVERLGIVVQRE